MFHRKYLPGFNCLNNFQLWCASFAASLNCTLVKLYHNLFFNNYSG